jgi:multimeric flavodoxin WrbA
MKTLMINASPKKNGFCAQISAQIINLLKSHTIKLINPYHLNILPCTGCETCKNTKHCILQDDMNEIYDLFHMAINIIIVSPIYFMHVPSPLKALIDRTQVFYHHPLKTSKNTLTIMAGENTNSRFAPYLELFWEYFFRNISLEKNHFILQAPLKNTNDIDFQAFSAFQDFLKGIS